MMRILGLCFALITVFLWAILTIQMISGTQPNPIAVLFTNPDGSPCQMPCLFGVRPGVTTLEEALQILDEHTLTTGMTIEHNMETDGQSTHLYSQESEIILYPADIDSTVIGVIALNYSSLSNPSYLCTPELALTMRQANPGNQTLYFGKIGVGLERGNQPPYIFQYCYWDNRVCFEAVEWQIGEHWQTEDFYTLTIGIPPPIP